MGGFLKSKRLGFQRLPKYRQKSYSNLFFLWTVSAFFTTNKQKQGMNSNLVYLTNHQTKAQLKLSNPMPTIRFYF